ncbi:dsDNA nuclease domain-containing protein [Metabacillus sp. HB246100]
MVKKREDIGAADKTSVGFEYQHYYFLYRLLTLKRDESIGYEVKDDVHIENIDGTIELIQVKHTLKVNVEGKAKNLTELDIDLWKTLSNWVTLIGEKKKPKSYLSKTSFVIATNKNDSTRNLFLTNLRKFNDNKISFDALLLYVEELINKTSNEELKEKIRNVIKFERELLAVFFRKLKFDLAIEDIIEKIKNEIKDHFISDERVNDVLICIEGNTRLWKYDVVKRNNKILISKDEVNRKLEGCFENYRKTTLPQRDIDTFIDDVNELKDLPFIQELIEINDISTDDYSEMVRYNNQMLKLVNNMNQWLVDGDLTEIDQKNFIEDSFTRWHRIHKRKHRKTRNIDRNNKNPQQEQELIDAALDCLDDVREIDLQIDGTNLTADMCNGNYYNLSNKKLVGWKVEWEDKYK